MLTKDEREQIAAQVRVAKDPSRSWSFWSVEYANDVAKLLHALDAADKRIAELEAENAKLRAALRPFAAIGELVQTSPLVYAQATHCIAAREALKEAGR